MKDVVVWPVASHATDDASDVHRYANVSQRRRLLTGQPLGQWPVTPAALRTAPPHSVPAFADRNTRTLVRLAPPPSPASSPAGRRSTPASPPAPGHAGTPARSAAAPGIARSCPSSPSQRSPPPPARSPAAP